jgi:hypothetical protein
MEKDNCSLCGTFCKLSFEHIPPKSAFNKKTRYKIVPSEQVLKHENILEAKFKSKIEQGGVGYYSLCRQCNNFLGLNYVNAYTAYSNSFIEFVKKKEFNYFELTMHDFEAAKVLKQIASMFISLNSWKFSESHSELRNYVLDRNVRDLPSRYRFFNYLKGDGDIRNATISVIGNINHTNTIMGSEIAFPPLGHIMTIDFKGHLPYHFEIAGFKRHGIDELISTEFNIYRLPTHIPIFLDYRSKEQIENAIKSSQQTAANMGD